ncbi:MAG: LVIVD repeat-containing protein [Actinomycetota bacterium]
MRRSQLLPALVAGLALIVGWATTPAHAAVDAANVRSVGHFAFPHGTDNAFHGRYVYAAQADSSEGKSPSRGDGGIHIIDISGATPRKVGFVRCSGYQNDVAVVKTGLIAVGAHHSSCGGIDGHAGVHLVDVRDPKRPRILGSVHLAGGTHTLTKVPGHPLIYSSPGGLGPPAEEWMIDVSDPNEPRVVGSFVPNQLGCHDISFATIKGRPLGFCASTNETLILDVGNPRKPTVVSRVIDGASFHHYAAPSPDGKLLVVNDENFIAHECVTAGRGVTGALWIHDISDISNPTIAGYVGPRRGISPVSGIVGGPEEWCTSHNFNFLPGTRTLVGAWYSGGTSVVDLTDPLAPREIAHYTPDDASAWSSYYYKGRIYVTDYHRGLDVIEIRKLR